MISNPTPKFTSQIRLIRSVFGRNRTRTGSEKINRNRNRISGRTLRKKIILGKIDTNEFIQYRKNAYRNALNLPFGHYGGASEHNFHCQNSKFSQRLPGALKKPGFFGFWAQIFFGGPNQKSAMISMCKIHIYIDSESFRQIH